jgi:hypothetical protein
MGDSFIKMKRVGKEIVLAYFKVYYRRIRLQSKENHKKKKKIGQDRWCVSQSSNQTSKEYSLEMSTHGPPNSVCQIQISCFLSLTLYNLI